jgi:predicted phage terminase large subunit-like protein
VIEDKKTTDAKIEWAAKREKCRTDPFYLSEILGYDFQPSVHADLFAQFPAITNRKAAIRDQDACKNSLILWPRGTFKTSATVLHIVRLILNFPDTRIMLMSGTLTMTRKWLAEIKAHFTYKNPRSRLHEIFPDFCRPDMGSAEAFTIPARTRVLKDPTVAALSQKKVATGSHGEFLFADDMVHTGNYRSVEQLDKLEEDFSSYVPLLDPGCYTVVTGTRYSPVDNYGRIIKRAAQKPGEWRISVKESRDASRVLLFPEQELKDGRKIGITNEMLDQIEKDDPVMYNAQYMNRIFATGRQIFPPELIWASTKHPSDPKFPKNGPCYFSVDLAPSDKAESDHSVIAVARRDPDGNLWVENVVGHTWTPAQTGTVLLNNILKYRPEIVFLEKAAGAEFFMEYMVTRAREHGIAARFELIKVSNVKDAKYLRISALESHFRNRRLFLCTGIQDFERLEEEFNDFPKGKYKDRPDAIALLVNHLSQVAPVMPRANFIVGPAFAPPTWDEAPKAPTNVLGSEFNC